MQLVLQADWQVLLHSPQPVTFFWAGRAIVLILFIAVLLAVKFFLPFDYNIPRKKLQAFLRDIVCEIILSADHCLPLASAQMAPLIKPASAPNARSSTLPQPNDISPAMIANKK